MPYHKQHIGSLLPLIFAALCSIACKKDNTNTTVPQSPVVQTPDTTSTPPATDSLTFLALGDSYTIGQSIRPQGRYPTQTVALLNADSMKVGMPKFIATTGWTTTNLNNAIMQVNPSPNYDIVTLLIGVNDQYQHYELNNYRQRFDALLGKAVLLAAGKKEHVFVVSIPDYSATPFVQQAQKEQVSKEIAEINAINKEVTLSYQIAYIDITPISEGAANDPTFTAYDQLHPSAKQYALWAAKLEPVIRHAFQ